jgi:hypothetical protein
MGILPPPLTPRVVLASSCVLSALVVVVGVVVGTIDLGGEEEESPTTAARASSPSSTRSPRTSTTHEPSGTGEAQQASRTTQRLAAEANGEEPSSDPPTQVTKGRTPEQQRVYDHLADLFGRLNANRLARRSLPAPPSPGQSATAVEGEELDQMLTAWAAKARPFSQRDTAIWAELARTYPGSVTVTELGDGYTRKSINHDLLIRLAGGPLPRYRYVPR